MPPRRKAQGYQTIKSEGDGKRDLRKFMGVEGLGRRRPPGGAAFAKVATARRAVEGERRMLEKTAARRAAAT
jgi:hypothetical protein